MYFPKQLSKLRVSMGQLRDDMRASNRATPLLVRPTTPIFDIGAEGCGAGVL